ncbi:MAG: translocation/assembly module TamB domain-containing protein [Deltaproteobacteria bacterium]|nr:translocation/assembly module TamB domain-containing protein [Deltaproteobacteria bacterium]
MKKSGFAKASLGLVVGVALGLAILALKAYIAEQVIELLEDEVVASCEGCHFVVDSVSLSFLGLSATATRPRLIENGKTKLEFKRIDAKVGLGKLSEHKVILSEIDLHGGVAYGVGPDSATFKFIDHLTEPVPPERDRPGRWKAVLDRLRVFNSRLIEPFTRSDLVGEGVTLEVQRDERDNFTLLPQIAELKVVSKTDPKDTPFKLGRLSGELYLGDDKADFKEIKLALARALIQGSALSHSREDNRLEGQLAFNIDAASYELPKWLRFNVKGEAELSGSLGRPDINGSLQAAEAPLEFVTGGQPRATFEDVNGDFSVHVRKGTSEASLQRLQAQSANGTLKLTSPFGIRDDNVFGRFSFQLDSLEFEDATFYNVRGEVSMSEKDYDIKVSSTAKAAAVVSHGFTFKDVNVGLNLQGEDLDIDFSHQSSDLGNFSAHGKIRMDEEPMRATIVEFQYSDFALFQPDWPSTVTTSVLESLRFTGAGTLKGPLTVSAIEASTGFTLSSTSLKSSSTFQGKAELRSGILKVPIADQGKALSLNLTFPLVGNEKSRLTLTANNLRPEDLFPQLECLDISGAADYSFDPDFPWAGSGEFKVAGLQFGCAPYTVSLEGTHVLKVNSGNVVLSAASFRGLDSSILMQGDISVARGFNLNAQGRLELNSLVGLLPAFDDLSGHIVASLDLKGPVESPSLTGKASLRKAEFSMEAANISASDINGDISIRGSTVQVENLQGNINGGTAQLRGTLLPLTPEKSALSLSAAGISIDPFPNTTLQLGGNLEMKELSGGVPSIEGKVLVEGGEFQKNLEVANLIRAFSDYVFARSPQVQQTRTLPRVDLNIAVTASRNLFMYTNWAGAEFRGDLAITGDLASPAINGAVETISGWFGIRDRRFEITSGTLTFKAGAPAPSLEIIGETYVPSYTGDTILIIAEARGALTNPKITFSSDRGLSEREILNLLAIGSNRGGQTLANTAARDLNMQNDVLFDESSILSIPRFFSSLTKINSLSIQPTYNVQTGLIEPAIVAEKYLSDYLTLVGESTFSGPTTESRLKLLYDLTPYIKLAGIAESTSTREKSALGTDITFTVLAKQQEFIKITLHGNKRLDQLKILKGIRLNPTSRVTEIDVPRLAEAMREYYHAQGFLEAHVSATCEDKERYCRAIVFDIQEGKLYHLRKVILEGDEVASKVDTEPTLRVTRRMEATEENLVRKRDGLTKRLRGEGYISARITGKYQFEPGSGNASLLLDVKAGKPVSFIFSGNSKFSAEEFLDTINLFNRKQPFGNNTINILIQNIERKYREAGYLYATMTFTKHEDVESGRITYDISINEDSPTRVTAVKFTGNYSLTTEELERIIGDESFEEKEHIFYPRYAIAEEIDQNISVLKNTFVEQGFPNVSITYRLLPLERDDQIEIVYDIREGSEIRADEMNIEGLPEGIAAPPAPAAPYSIPKANRYIEQILNVLKDRGYLNPSFSSALPPSGTGRMSIQIDPGIRTHIGEIFIEGNVGIDTEVIRRNLAVKVGEPWDSELINDSKRKLLKLGLFSRVEIAPMDTSVDSAREDMIIRLSERPLTTLDVGGGANSELGLHVFSEAIDRSFFRDGRTLSLRADLYYDVTQKDFSQGVAGLRYADPYFLSTNYSLAEELRFEKLDQSTLPYDLNRVSLASYVYRSWDSGFSSSFGHTILDDNITEVDPDAILSPLDNGNVKLSFASAVFGYDRRDNPLTPTRGYNLNLDLKFSNEVILSDANYYSVGARASWLVPVKGTRFSFAFSTRGASSWTYAGTQQIPITQRYYLGGRNSVRGYKENSLGPRGEDGSIVGGDMLLNANSELRYLLENNLSLHLFLDAGNVFLRGYESSQYDLDYGAGVGMRFLSPIGPIGFDVGHPFNGQNEPAVRFSFNIGTNF